MSTDIIRAFITDALTTMTTEELSNIIKNAPDRELEAVGARVLVEKRKKTTQIIQHGVKVPVGAMEEEREAAGGPVTQTAKKIRKKAVAKKAVGTGQKARPSKRKYDAIDITSDTSKVARDVAGSDHDEDMPTESCGTLTTPAIPSGLLKGVRGNDRQRLTRLTKIMAQIDWDQVQCRDDMITYLFQGESNMGQHSWYKPETIITTKEQMGRSIDDHQLKLRYHPRFAAVYDQQNNNLPVASTSNLTTKPLTPASSKQIGYPPYDWGIILKKLGAADHAGKRTICDNIAIELDRACREIIGHYDPRTSKTPDDIMQVVDDVQMMDRLATDICPAPTSELRHAMRLPTIALRECMSLICTQLAKHPLPFLGETLGEEQLKMVLHKLSMIDAIMKKMNPRSGVESGIEKLKHMF